MAGQPCQGYLSSDSGLVTGMYICQYCEDTTGYHGDNGGKCDGFNSMTGKTDVGFLARCK